MNTVPIRIMLIDDHKIVRESWKMLLENNAAFTVVGECPNGDNAVEMANELLPDIILVDINMTPHNGFTVTERILASLPSIRIIGLSANNQPKYATKMLALGARGYMTKTSSLEEINIGILQVYNGEIYVCEEVRKHIKA